MLFLASTTIVWGLALTALLGARRGWRERHRRPREAVCHGWFAATTLCLAVSFTLLQRPAYTAVDRALGTPNGARLLANLLAIAAAWCIGRWLAAMPAPPLSTMRLERASRSPGLAAAALIAITALGLIGPRGAAEPDDFVARYGTSGAVLASRLVFSGYLGLMAAALCRRTWAYRQATRHPLKRLALALQAAGWASGALYLAHEAGYATARYCGGPYPAGVAARAQDLLIAGTIVPVALGRAVPALAATSRRLRGWLTRYRAYRELGQLAAALPAGGPRPPADAGRAGRGGAARLRHLDLDLHFRVMAIRDGAMCVGERVTPGLLAEARELAGRCDPGQGDAALDGACIALALRVGDAEPPHGGAGWQLGGPALTDLTSEATYLQQVSRAWRAVSATLDTTPRRIAA